MPSHSNAASRRSSANHRGTQHNLGDDSASSIGDASTSMLDDPKYAIASKFLSTMLQEVVIDTALLIHTQTIRQRRSEGKIPGGCPVCKSTCQKSSENDHQQAAATTIIKTEVEEGETSPSLAQESTAPKGLEMYQNNPLLTCLVCSRQVSANRYAQHLASCVGVGKGGIARRKGKHGANGLASAKDRMRIKTALENRKKANFQTQSNRNTPTPSTRQERESPSGNSDDDSGSRRGKISSHLNANGKRGISPGNDSNKKGRYGSEAMSKTSSQPFAPSGLGSSLPVTGSPLRKSKSASALGIDEDEEENDDDEDNDNDEADDDVDDDADDDDEDDGEEDDDDEEDENDDDDEDDDGEDEDDASLALGKSRNGDHRASSLADSYDDESDDARSEAISDSVSLVTKRKEAVSTRPIERSRGSDGEYIDVESASAHSEEPDDF